MFVTTCSDIDASDCHTDDEAAETGKTRKQKDVQPCKFHFRGSTGI